MSQHLPEPADRGPVMLDADLARLFGTPAKSLNEPLKRNLDRGSGDAFQLAAVRRWRSWP